MSCSPTDLRDYFFGELPESSRPKLVAHIKTCENCREELDRLRVTQTALLSLPDEEIPQRIRFVSDKVFEPSPVRRWFGALWENNGKLVFASAALLSGAILFSSLYRPAPMVALQAPSPAPVTLTTASQQSGDVQQRIDEAVRKAVADSEARQAKKTETLVAEERRQSELARQEIKLQVKDWMDITEKRLQRNAYLAVADNSRGPQ